MNFFASVDAWLIAILLGAAMSAAWAVGWRFGRASGAAGDGGASGKFEDSSLALLGLLLAFTFSMALAKHDHRRETLVADSNAIGDFYTCATLLDDPVRTKLQDVIREYTTLRLEASRHLPSEAFFHDALSKLQSMQGRMTALVSDAIHAGTPIVVPLTNTLNGLTSAHAARLSAIRDRLPASIVVLLFFASLVSAGVIGRHLGVAGKPHLVGMGSFVVLVVLVVYVTLDLNQPHRGLITVSQEPMERLLASMTP